MAVAVFVSSLKGLNVFAVRGWRLNTWLDGTEAECSMMEEGERTAMKKKKNPKKNRVVEKAQAGIKQNVNECQKRPCKNAYAFLVL